MTNYAIALPNFYQQFTTSTKAALITAVLGYSSLVGWTNTAISAGYRFLLISPEGYKVYLEVTDPYSINPSFGHPGCVSFQFKTFSIGGPVAPTGPQHLIQCCSDDSHQTPITYGRAVQMHPCGFALWMPGTSFAPGNFGPPIGSYVMGGIPFIGQLSNQGCTGQTAAVTNAWFSFGDQGADFRAKYLDARQGISNVTASSANTAVLNSLIATGFSLDVSGFLGPQVMRRSAFEFDALSSAYAGNSEMLWYGELDFAYPALVAFGSSSFTAIGQIYNAIIRTMPTPMDTLASWDNYSWINLTNAYFYGGVWLLADNNLKPGPTKPGAGNYAY